MHHDLPDTYPSERRELQVIATHLLARRLVSATGRFGLRPTPDGFGTPQFDSGEPDRRRERVRISGGLLVVERLDPAATTTATLIDGASTRELATFVGVTLDAPDDGFDVGHDTPPIGDPDRRVAIGESTFRATADWFATVAAGLDVVAGSVTDPRSTPTVAQIWPEHFDLAFDLAFDPTRADTHRVNLGGAVGDDLHAEPYLYVGPWTGDRPGDPEFWNAPFGAVLPRAQVLTHEHPATAAAEFFRRGLDLLSTVA